MSDAGFAMTGLEPGFDQTVRRPIGEASGLPNAAYRSEAYAAYERDHVFAKTWACVGAGAEVPKPGDVKPLSLMGLPLVLLRDHEGEIKVFHNVCSHRGMELVSGPRNVGKLIRCPYHSWSYDLAGRLRATPYIGGPRQNHCEGFDKARHGLKPVRSAVWLDQVFVNISGDAPDFADYIAPLAERWQAFDGSLLRHGGPESHLMLDLACNWKLAVENFCEAYHLPWIHPGLNSYSRLDDHYNIELEGHFSGQGSRAFFPAQRAEGPPFPHFPGLPEAWDRRAEYIALYPNVMLGVHCDHVFAVRLEPQGPERTLEYLDIYYVGTEPLGEDHAAIRRANAVGWRVIFEEDRGVVEGMQRGRASPAFTGGVFSPALDGPTHCFHRWVAERIAAARDQSKGNGAA